jgi:hypothetical protein
MITITPAQFPAWIRRECARQGAAIRRGMQTAAMLTQGKCVMRTGRTKPWPAVDTGRLKSSWRVEIFPSGPLVARVFNDAPHAPFVEYGVRPGRIPTPYRRGYQHPRPFPALVAWVQRKFRRQLGGGGRGMTGAIREFNAFRIAVAIQQKLHARGIQGRHILTEPAFVAATGRLTKREVAAELRAGRQS